jgi:hypothetical protein
VDVMHIRLSIMDYNEAPEALVILLMNVKTLHIKKRNPRR